MDPFSTSMIMGGRVILSHLTSPHSLPLFLSTLYYHIIAMNCNFDTKEIGWPFLTSTTSLSFHSFHSFFLGQFPPHDLIDPEMLPLFSLLSCYGLLWEGLFGCKKAQTRRSEMKSVSG